MPLHIIRSDITKMKCDAIVNASNSSLSGGGGVNGAIHWAAGAELIKECKKLGGCKTGEAKITDSYHLPCKYIIHAVGPIWKYGNKKERKLLTSCYQESLKLADEKACRSIAFPLISAGGCGYPKEEVLDVAVDIISQFLKTHDMTVYIVIHGKSRLQISERFLSLEKYIEKNYIETEEKKLTKFQTVSSKLQFSLQNLKKYLSPKEIVMNNDENKNEDEKQLNVNFPRLLLNTMSERNINSTKLCLRSNIETDKFGSIITSYDYFPSKDEVLAFAIALELDMGETEEFLNKAGYEISHTNKTDIIVEYFIKKKFFNIHRINEALFVFGQTPLR